MRAWWDSAALNVSLNRTLMWTTVMRTTNVGTGPVRRSTCSPPSATLLAWETYGDSRIWPTRTEEVNGLTHLQQKSSWKSPLLISSLFPAAGRRLPHPLLRDVGGYWHSSLLPGKCFWTILQPRSNQHLESCPDPAGWVWGHSGIATTRRTT